MISGVSGSTPWPRPTLRLTPDNLISQRRIPDGAGSSKRMKSIADRCDMMFKMRRGDLKRFFGETDGQNVNACADHGSSGARYDDVRIECRCPHSGKLRYRAQPRLGMRITHLRFRCVL
jgi:hypothetical protein